MHLKAEKLLLDEWTSEFTSKYRLRSRIVLMPSVITLT